MYLFCTRHIGVHLHHTRRQTIAHKMHILNATRNSAVKMANLISNHGVKEQTTPIKSVKQLTHGEGKLIKTVVFNVRSSRKPQLSCIYLHILVDRIFSICTRKAPSSDHTQRSPLAYTTA